EDGRIVVVGTGTLTLRTADTFDTGLYHCVGTNSKDADILSFRITVVDPYVERSSVNGAQLSASVGGVLYLPCASAAVPDAAISWVLPGRVVLHHSAGNKHIFDNGTLRIQGVTERDSGYFRCVAANQYGADLLIFQVVVRKDKSIPQKVHVAAGEWEESDGSGNAMLASARRQKSSSAPLATLAVEQEPAASAPGGQAAQSAHGRKGRRRTAYHRSRDKMSRRLRGQRRQFGSSARRADPQRWAALLEKAKRNSTLAEQQVATKPPAPARKVSKVPVEEEETSGDPLSPEQEFMIPVSERASVFSLRRATGSAAAAGPTMAASSSPTGTASPLPAPASLPVSPGSEPQPQLNPTGPRERPDLGQESADGMNRASRTSELFSAQQRPVSAAESNNQRLKPASGTPVTDVTGSSQPATSQNPEGKLQVVTGSAGRIATKADGQAAVATAGEPRPGFGRLYFHSAQKPAAPKRALGSNTFTHQHAQTVQGVVTRAPQAQQQYGRRRKISGRRKIIRPGRIPSLREHRHGFGKQGSARGSTAAAPGVLLNSKYTSSSPALDNLSSSTNPVSPEAPLPSPPTTSMPPEHPAGTVQSTAFLVEESREPAARQGAASTAVPFGTSSAQAAPQREAGPGAPFRSGADRAQPFGTGLPAAAAPTARGAAETAHARSTGTPSAAASAFPRTSSENSQGGKTSGERVFENATDTEVLRKLPKQQTDALPAAEVPALPPDAAAATPAAPASPLQLAAVPAGTGHSGGFPSASKPAPHGSGKSEEQRPAAQLPSYSTPAAGTTKQMARASLKATAAPSVTPQADTKITRRKAFGVGRKRGQRRRRPPKTSASQSSTAGPSPSAVPPARTAGPPAA
ncbi:IGS10 protein, partial [Alectura lathami]|nr:IGS10 protein [Alectura lathami]